MVEFDYFNWEKEYSIPISALQHFVYCPRQFALIHIEEIYEENIYTLKGNYVHKRVDNETNYYNNNIDCENSLPIWSDKFGIYGVIDVVEFHDGVPFPVEFKSGKKKKKMADEIQLCAEAVCLEEMFECKVAKGAIYYYSSRRRKEVNFTETLRKRLIETIEDVRNLLQKRFIPVPVRDKRCKNCSLKELCLPDLNIKSQKVKAQFKKLKESKDGSKD